MSEIADRPEPMTPPYCDLRGHNWMPLLGHRLFSSKWYAMARRNSRGGIAALKLWWVSFLQHPAASLPDDEEELCMLADFGEDMKAWKKHREVAMHGFVLCSDGRWYHPVVAEEAVESYRQRIQKSKGRETDAERLRRWRARRNGHEPPPGNAHETPSETRFETPYETPQETASETQGERVSKRVRQYKTVQDLTEQTVSEDLSLTSKEELDTAREQKPATEAADRVGPEATAEVIGLIRGHLRSTMYAPGRKPKLTVEEQIEAVAPRKIKSVSVSPEQLAQLRAMSRRRA